MARAAGGRRPATGDCRSAAGARYVGPPLAARARRGARGCARARVRARCARARTMRLTTHAHDPRPLMPQIPY